MFDLARFRRLIAATWVENRRAWAWFLAIGIIVHCVLCVVLLVPEHGYRALSEDGQGIIWLLGLVLTGIIFAGRYFAAMARRESALVLLMRPASAFEKWLLAVLVVAVLYPVAYTLAFQVCNVPAALIAEALAHAAGDAAAAAGSDAAGLADVRFGVFLPWTLFEKPAAWYTLFSMLGALQAFAMLGSLYFRSFPFIKTILAGFILALLLILATTIGGGDPDLFLGYWVTERELHRWQQLLFPAAWIAIPALTWLASLVALRERQVA